MSDLIVSPKNIPVPPQACSQEPSPPLNEDLEEPNPVDDCFFKLPLLNQKNPRQGAKLIRFDRRGNQFVLSNQNSSEDLTWITKFNNLKEILTVTRLMEQIYQGLGNVRSASEHAIITMLAQFIVNGRIRFPEGPHKKDTPNIPGKIELAHYLLDIFDTSAFEEIQKLFGTLILVRRDNLLDESSRQRIDWINSLVDLIPKHRAFLKHFIGSYQVEPWAKQPPHMQKVLYPILRLSRTAVINYWMKLPMKWSPETYDAYRGFQQFHPMLEESTHQKTFCGALANGQKELRGKNNLTSAFTVQCRRALSYQGLKPNEALRESIISKLSSSNGLNRLQKLVALESQTDNLSVKWLHQRGQISSMATILLRHVTIAPSEKSSLPKLKINQKALIGDLRANLASQIKHRREHLISALALLRYFFGNQGRPLGISVFWKSDFSTLEWELLPSELSQIRQYMLEIKKSLNLNHKKPGYWTPLAQGTVCAGGIISTLAFQRWGNPYSSSQRNFTLGSYASTGAGCGSLLGHFLLPKVLPKKMGNHYLWDGASGLGGALIGVGIYFLINSSLTPPQNPARNPVDEYGP